MRCVVEERSVLGRRGPECGVDFFFMSLLPRVAEVEAALACCCMD